jgi:hypothetical protein
VPAVRLEVLNAKLFEDVPYLTITVPGLVSMIPIKALLFVLSRMVWLTIPKTVVVAAGEITSAVTLLPALYAYGIVWVKNRATQNMTIAIVTTLIWVRRFFWAMVVVGMVQIKIYLLMP